MFSLIETIGAFIDLLFFKLPRVSQLEYENEVLKAQLDREKKNFKELHDRSEGIFTEKVNRRTILEQLEIHFNRHECKVEVTSIKAIFYYWQKKYAGDGKSSRLPIHKYHQFIRWADRTHLIHGDSIQLKPAICRSVLISKLGAEWVPF